MGSNVYHLCSRCECFTAAYTYGGDTDGVSWSTECSTHTCEACGHVETVEHFVQYNCERFGVCGVCSKREYERRSKS